MIPNIIIHEKFMFEHHQDLQREMAQQRLVAGLLRDRPSSLARRFAAGAGTMFRALGTRLRRLEWGAKTASPL